MNQKKKIAFVNRVPLWFTNLSIMPNLKVKVSCGLEIIFYLAIQNIEAVLSNDIFCSPSLYATHVCVCQPMNIVEFPHQCGDGKLVSLYMDWTILA